MTLVELAVLAVVGVLAGLVSTVVSLASIVSYPALLALGLPPVAANVTNTVSLVFTSFGAAAGSRPELAGQGRRVLAVGAVAAGGGGLGAALLLRTPPTAFSAAVPVLIALASAAILVQPWLTLRTRTVGGAPSWWWGLGVVAAAVYTGYFGAAGGVLMLAALGGLLRDELVRLNALKNVIGGLANGVASVGFALFGPVHWAVVVPLASGFLVGGSVGPRLARRLPTGSLRRLIAGTGLTVAAVLTVRTYT